MEPKLKIYKMAILNKLLLIRLNYFYYYVFVFCIFRKALAKFAL